MSNSIDDSYQVSLHLTERIQRRRLKCEKLTDDRRWTPSDGKSSLCLWQGELIIIKIYILLIEITAMIFPQYCFVFSFLSKNSELQKKNCPINNFFTISSKLWIVNPFQFWFFCVFFFTYTSCNVHCSKDQINKIVVNHRIELQYYYKPLLDVYRSAAWKHATLFSVNESSIDICIPNPASGLMLGSDNKSVDRTKKFPWKVWMLNPV